MPLCCTNDFNVSHQGTNSNASIALMAFSLICIGILFTFYLYKHRFSAIVSGFLYPKDKATASVKCITTQRSPSAAKKSAVKSSPPLYDEILNVSQQPLQYHIYGKLWPHPSLVKRDESRPITKMDERPCHDYLYDQQPFSCCSVCPISAPGKILLQPSQFAKPECRQKAWVKRSCSRLSSDWWDIGKEMPREQPRKGVVLEKVPTCKNLQTKDFETV